MWVFVAQAAIVAACFALAVFAGTPVVRRLLVRIENRDEVTPPEVESELTVGGEPPSVAPVSQSGALPGLQAAGEQLKGGYWIGLLERAALFACVLSGFPAGIAVVLGVKGLGRYPELRTPTGSKGELFIIGTFSSMLWAALWSGLAWGLIRLW
ncbi:hypothetical protein [Tessaracoccus antarcticus]|uniref:hypothetical protein n=1 Tax=Tessaracoccus antarcticus TaxID=2479848 RepID=UPI001F2E87EC|nr:hypothetical protein [Tessaracoccus antarcticus]